MLIYQCYQRTKLAEEREMGKQINIAVTNNEDGDETEFLERVNGVDFSENAIASPQRGTLRPRPRSAPHHAKNNKTKHKTTPLNHHEPTTISAPLTPKSDKKKKKKITLGTYHSDLNFHDPPEIPSPIPISSGQGCHSPTIGARQQPKKKNTCATFNPDEWWNEQQRMNPDAVYKVAIRRSQSDPVLKRPKSATSRSKLASGEKAMSTKDLKTYLTVSEHILNTPDMFLF
jgi:hypothetical protein